MYKVVSIFSGAGGLDLGFKQQDFEKVLSVESWDVACKTLKKNDMSNRILNEDIRKIDFTSELKLKGIGNEVDVLIGGPPCPPYSQTRHYLEDKKNGFEDKESGYGVLEFIRALKEIEPKVFLFENVAGFSYKTHKYELDYFVSKATELGYQITYKVVNCADYGIPQTRKRFFMIGSLPGIRKFEFPKETHSNKNKINKEPWVTCGDVLSDFDDITNEEKKTIPGGRHSDLLKLIPPGDNYLYFTEKRGHKKPKFKWKSRYWTFLLKLTPNRPSWTIQASFSTNQGPFHWRNRFLRIEEIKRLQTFPDEYEFCGDFKDQWRQIGNAVPVKMANILAKEIKDMLDE